jgi:hypothetical protein
VFNATPTDEGAAGEPPADEGTASRKMGPSTCTKIPDGGTIGQVECCAVDLDTSTTWCTTCAATNPPSNCGPAEQEYPSRPQTPQSGGVLETDPTTPSGPAIPGGGIFQTPSAPLTPDDTVTPKGGGVFNTPQTGGVFNIQPPPTDEGAAGAPPPVDESTLPPTEEGTPPPTLTEEPAPPVCLEGQVLDEQTGLCVLEEPEVPEVEPGQSEQEGQEQSAEEGDGSEDGNDNN